MARGKGGAFEPAIEACAGGTLQKPVRLVSSGAAAASAARFEQTGPREALRSELPPYSSSPSLTLALPYVQCAAGQLWRALPETKKAKYKAGLTCLAPLGQGGKRTWVPTSAPSLLLAPTTKATMMHSNERRSSGSCHFTVTPVPPRPPTAPAAASAAVPHAPSITPTIPSSSWLKQQQLEEESSGSVWKASGVSQSK